MVSYESCVYTDVWELMMTFYIKRTLQERKVCLDSELIFPSKKILQAYTEILQGVRIVELVGLSISFISVLLSLLIFFTLK